MYIAVVFGPLMPRIAIDLEKNPMNVTPYAKETFGALVT
jgi:hypothetical protein